MFKLPRNFFWRSFGLFVVGIFLAIFTLGIMWLVPFVGWIGMNLAFCNWWFGPDGWDPDPNPPTRSTLSEKR